MSKTVLRNQNCPGNMMQPPTSLHSTSGCLGLGRLDHTRSRLGHSGRFGEPGSVQELLVGTDMVAYLLKFLPLLHPSQYGLHLCFAC
ncbi:hypothetical protein Hanom_Chr11g00975651 [Helianthus anomalus]